VYPRPHQINDLGAAINIIIQLVLIYKYVKFPPVIEAKGRIQKSMSNSFVEPAYTIINKSKDNIVIEQGAAKYTEVH